LCMSDKQFEHFLNVVNKLDIPDSDEMTDESRDLFESGRDVMLMYRGHPDTLMQALQLFMATDCRPFVYAGAAIVIMSSSYISDGKYDPAGVKEALKLLDQAKQTARSRCFAIEMIEPGFHSNLGDLKKARNLLDKLGQFDEAQTSYRFAIAEMDYADKTNDMTGVKYWNELGFKRAQNNIQRLYALNALAGTFLMKKKDGEALGLYHEVVKIDPSDPWAWHNMSIIYMRRGDYSNSGYCNDRALSLMDFGAARHVLGNLINRWSKSRNPDILDDIPPYTIQAGQNQPNASQSFFKKLLGS
jgi:tetratricopeptide (TPR) repeat protein